MKLRPFFGLLVAPLVPAVIAALLAGLRNSQFDYDTSLVVAVMCLAGGYVSGFCIGWPLLMLWRRLRWTGPIAGTALGAVSAAGLTFIVAVIFAPFRGEVTLVQGFLNLLTLTTPVGAIGGLVFWSLSMRERIDSAGGAARLAPAARRQIH